MRQMTGTMLLLSSAAVIAAPWTHAEEKTIRLTEAEQQEIKTANEKLLGLTLRFLHDSWPLEIMFPGEAQEEFHSILQFRQTGSLLLQTPDRTTPLHLCIALGLNQLAVRMVEKGAPVNAQSIFMHDGTKEPGDTPLTWACLSGLYMNSTAEERLPLVHALLKHGADPDLPGPWGVTPFMYSAALNDSDPGQEKIALALLDAGSPDLKRRMNAQARGVGFLSLSSAIYERLIKAGCDVNERFFESKQSPLHLICTKEKPSERLIPLIELLIKAGADPNQPDVDGLTPLTAYDFHMKNGYPSIAETIKLWQSKQKKGGPAK